MTLLFNIPAWLFSHSWERPPRSLHSREPNKSEGGDEDAYWTRPRNLIAGCKKTM